MPGVKKTALQASVPRVPRETHLRQIAAWQPVYQGSQTLLLTFFRTNQRRAKADVPPVLRRGCRMGD